jgi:hypothetical protein
MAWSLLNHMIAGKVTELLDAHKDDYPPEVRRLYSREQALSIIHAAIWGYACRADSSAAAYAGSHMFEALGLKGWTWDESVASALQLIMSEHVLDESRSPVALLKAALARAEAKAAKSPEASGVASC